MLTSTNHGPTATPEQEPIIHDEYDNIVSDVRKKLIKVNYVHMNTPMLSNLWTLNHCRPFSYTNTMEKAPLRYFKNYFTLFFRFIRCC